MSNLEAEITQELIDDLEKALKDILVNLVPNASFRIQKFKRGEELGLTLTLHSSTYPRFIKLGTRDVQPLRPTAARRLSQREV